MKKKICAIVLSVLLVCLTFSLSACNLFKPDDNGSGTEGTSDKMAYVSLDINPAIELIVDNENKVISVRGENEDGQVLLYDESGIVGENIEQAINKITDLSIKYGYLDESNKVIDTIVTSGDNDFASEILSKVNTSITATASNLGLSVKTDGEGAYSLLRKMNEIKKDFPNNSYIQNMSVEKFKLALSVSETGDISFDVAVSLDDAQLITMLKDASAQIEAYATDAYLEAKTKALAIYSQITEIAGYSVYTKYYLENMSSHLTTAYYGGIYQMYASAAIGFNSVCDIAQFATKLENYPLDNSQINVIVNILGLESSAVIANSDGDVTIESIEAYADKLFKNTPASELLNQTKQMLTEALSQTTTIIKEKIIEMSSEYRPQIESALAKANEILNAVEQMFNTLPDAIKSIITTCENDLKDILAQVEILMQGDSINLDELKVLADRLDVKATEYYNKIKADLTAEEWATLENMRLAEIAKYSQQKAELDETLDRACQAAKDYLSNLKAQRLAQ